MLGHSFEKYTYEQFRAKSDNYANGAYPSSSFDLINAGPNIYAGDISYNFLRFGVLLLVESPLNWDNKIYPECLVTQRWFFPLRRIKEVWLLSLGFFCMESFQ